jgi:hypothetical protein
MFESCRVHQQNQQVRASALDALSSLVCLWCAKSFFYAVWLAVERRFYARRSLGLHTGCNVRVNVQGERSRAMAESFGYHFRVYASLEQ